MVRKSISIFNDLGSTKLGATADNFLNIVLDEQEIRWDQVVFYAAQRS